MQSGQVSVWVPIVVAMLSGVLGVIGVLLGQWFSGRRERERMGWDRLRQAEDHKHELRKHWSDKKFECCAELVIMAEQLHEFLRDEGADGAPVDGEEDKAVELSNAMGSQLTRLYLLSSKALTDAAHALWDHLANRVLSRYDHQREPVPTEVYLRLMVAFQKRVTEELGVNDWLAPPGTRLVRSRERSHLTDHDHPR